MELTGTEMIVEGLRQEKVKMCIRDRNWIMTVMLVPPF